MPNNTFQTSNLSLAASILASGKANFLKQIAITSYKNAYVFEPKAACEEIERLYVNNKISLPVRTVEENIKTLKSLSRKGGYYRE